MISDKKRQLKVQFSSKMIPDSTSKLFHVLIYFSGMLNFLGYYFFGAFINKISYIFDSAAVSILCVL